MTMHSFAATTATFERDVLEASQLVPVVVDFWAPWCGPCRALTPILDKLANEYDGQFRLAKVNTDEHPEVAMRYGVRGIPNVKAFVAGKVVNEFTGAVPESAVRRFLDDVIPSAAERLRQRAREDIARREVDAAEAKLREAIALDSDHFGAHIDLAELLVMREDFARAELALEAVPQHVRDDRAEALAAKIAFSKKAQGLPDASALRAKIEANPHDFDTRLSLAERMIAEGQYQVALDELLEVVRRAQAEKREQARQMIVAVFNLMGDQPDLVGEYRRLLSAALY
jgi:putative thioredoxin